MRWDRNIACSLGLLWITACSPAPPSAQSATAQGPDAAANCIQAVWTSTPAAPPATGPRRGSLQTAQNCIQRGELACAERELRGDLAQYPDDQRSAATLAIVLTQEGRHSEALSLYTRAERTGLGAYDLYANHARSLDAAGDLPGAICLNRRALEVLPTLVDVRGSLAQQLVRSGRPREALDLLESFDRSLTARGEAPYFAAQILSIRDSMASQPPQAQAAP